MASFLLLKLDGCIDQRARLLFNRGAILILLIQSKNSLYFKQYLFRIFASYVSLVMCVCVCVCVCACACAPTQSCPALCNSVDYSWPDFSVHGILQARIREWVVLSSSRGSSWARDRTSIFWVGRRILLPLSPLGSPISLVNSSWKSLMPFLYFSFHIFKIKTIYDLSTCKDFVT